MAISSALESSASGHVYRFGEFVLDVDRGALTLAGRDLALRPKTYSVLLYLVEHHGRLVSRGEIFKSVWGDTIVTDGSVTQCLIEIRRALGDSDQSKIRTVPKRGYVFELPVETVRGFKGDRNVADRSNRTVSWLPVIVTVLGLFFVGLIVWRLTGTSNDLEQNTITVDRMRSSPSIAVLPFVDMSPNQDQEYFADGMSDEVLSLLGRVRGLRVTARTSSFSFKNESKSIAEIAASLDVSHVLQGSVRRIDDRIRVSAQLIDASTSEQIWSESFDREFDDVFEVQDHISAAVVDRLELSFSDQLSQFRHATPEAYSLYLQAIHLLGQGSAADATTTARAEALLLEALQLDPNNGPAWREIARLRWRQIGAGPSAREEIDMVWDALNRSFAIDPNDPATLAYLAAATGDFDGDTERAARLYERAIALNPADEHVLRTALIFLTNHGDPVDAIALGEYGMLHNPVCYLCVQNLWFAYLGGQQYNDAESLARSIVSLHDNGHFMVGHALLLQGRPEEALSWFSKEPYKGLQVTGKAMALHDLSRHSEAEALFAMFPDPTKPRESQSIHIWAYAWTGQLDAAFETLERVLDRYQKYDGEIIVRQIPWQMPRIARSPFLAPLHDDPRWESIATRLGITDELQAELDFDLPSRVRR